VGQEITAKEFSDEDFARFRTCLDSEMKLLSKWFSNGTFCVDALQCGLELEAWLVDLDGKPVPDNRLFLEKVDREWVVPELAKFNFELNVKPQYIAGAGLVDMRSEIRSTWEHCHEVASQLDHRIVSIGTLPTVTDTMLCVKNMSSLRRYAALTEQVLRQRGGRAIELRIDGLDTLVSSHHDLMLEAAATSLQVHLKVPAAVSKRYYNASVIASAFTVALAANAPILFGKRLWDDTRISVFEQAVDTAGPEPRVTFGADYIHHSLFEIFERNHSRHRILLPEVQNTSPDQMTHVRMHNGTIWHWNRPLIGFESDGTPHLRIEHRPMSASPSLNDLTADIVFYLGLTHALATSKLEPESQLPFEAVKRNFYAAAQHGFAAPNQWLDGKEYVLAFLASDRVLPLASEGMVQLGIDAELIDNTVEILRGRIESRQNGAAWQRRKIIDFEGDVRQLTQAYIQNQSSGHPIHTWE